MFNIKTYNNISEKGLNKFSIGEYNVSESHESPDAIILRSYNLHDEDFPSSLKVVGRAGAGTNNVPVKQLSKRGVPVFNAPGANANAVKELVIAGMLLACRNVVQAWSYAGNVEGSDEEQQKAVEAGKKKYVGYELPNRTLGVIGLGAIGVEIANAAIALGMNVVGYDETITVKSAWKLSSKVEEMTSVEDLLKQCDFVTFHVPLVEGTKKLLNKERIAMMKDGAVVLNFARQGIIDDDAILAAIETGKINTYVCDFPSEKFKNNHRVITLPHLGASTAEAEDNCAVMVAEQIIDYLENGNIRNSVNFPNIKLPRSGEVRLAVSNENRPDMVGQISHILGAEKVNILHMRNESRDNLAYTLIDLDSRINEDVLEKINNIDGVLLTRQLK